MACITDGRPSVFLVAPTLTDRSMMCLHAAGVSSQAKAALGVASEATSGARTAASGALNSLNQATSGAVDSASAALKDLSSGFNEAGTSLQVTVLGGYLCSM